MDFGEKLKKSRKNRNETLHMVAMGTNIDMTLLSKFERGERLPTPNQVQKLARHFGLDNTKMEIEVIAGRILNLYGYKEVTYWAAKHVQERMEKYNTDKNGRNKK